MRTRLQPGETVALIVRKHWIVLAKPTLFCLAVLFSFPLRYVRLAGFEAMLSYFFPYLFATSAGLLVYRYLDRKVNIWVVTSDRLIDEFGLVTHRSKENPLDKINDIVVEQTIAGRIFNYGSISVQTAAKAGETLIEFVERPEELKQTINAQKALHAERESRPNAAGRELPLRQGSSLPQTMLIHESLKPPFSLRCPHCAGEIIIDYAGTVASTIAGTCGAKKAVKETAHASEHSKETPLLDSSHGTMQSPVADEAERGACEHNALADPFSWKRASMKNHT